MSMPPFVRDPKNITHRIQPYCDPNQGWMTVCDEKVLFSQGWRSLFPAEGQATCLMCLSAG
jgi:hypothetical protein